MKPVIKYLIILLLGLVAGWFATYSWFKSLPKEVEIVEVIKYKYKDSNPTPQSIKPVDVKVPTLLIFESVKDSIQYITQEIHVTDTLTLKGEQKHYSDSTYDAWVSGVAVQLDSIHTYNTTTIIHKTTPYKKHWELGPVASTQFSASLLQMSLGLSLEVPINRWELGITGGYQVTAIKDQPLNTGPFGMVTAKFNIFN